jgi:hypothetical protein
VGGAAQAGFEAQGDAMHPVPGLGAQGGDEAGGIRIGGEGAQEQVHHQGKALENGD